MKIRFNFDTTQDSELHLTLAHDDEDTDVCRITVSFERFNDRDNAQIVDFFVQDIAQLDDIISSLEHIRDHVQEVNNRNTPHFREIFQEAQRRGIEHFSNKVWGDPTSE